MSTKRNVTVRLDAEIIRKAKILAAQRSMSISRLVANEIERLVGEEDAYLAAQADALAMLERDNHLGGGPLPPRDDLHR